MNKKIILTGGGSLGHVTPNISLVPTLKKCGYKIHYIGSNNGIEKDVVINAGLPFHGIYPGKFRRYISMKNFFDMFRVIAGIYQSVVLILKIKPNIVFSKGGFVSCPVVWAAWLCRVNVIIHESDITPGLANRLSLPFAKKICVTFPYTLSKIRKSKGVLTGLPIRSSLISGNPEQGLEICGFDSAKKTILIIGGCLGARKINEIIRTSLKELTKQYQICHICGKNNLDIKLTGTSSYFQIEYADEKLPHLFQMADLIISRAGATTINEILSLQKPSILIPLPLSASRGDQLLNARYFEEKGYSKVIHEDVLNQKTLLNNVHKVFLDLTPILNNLKQHPELNSSELIVNQIQNNS